MSSNIKSVEIWSRNDFPFVNWLFFTNNNKGKFASLWGPFPSFEKCLTAAHELQKLYIQSPKWKSMVEKKTIIIKKKINCFQCNCRLTDKTVQYHNFPRTSGTGFDVRTVCSDCNKINRKKKRLKKITFQIDDVKQAERRVIQSFHPSSDSYLIKWNRINFMSIPKDHKHPWKGNKLICFDCGKVKEIHNDVCCASVRSRTYAERWCNEIINKYSLQEETKEIRKIPKQKKEIENIFDEDELTPDQTETLKLLLH